MFCFRGSPSYSSSPPNIVNVASGKACSVSSILNLLLQIWNNHKLSPSQIENISFNSSPTPGAPSALIANISLLESYGFSRTIL